MTNSLFSLYEIIKSPYFLLSIVFISLLVKIYFLKVFIPKGMQKTTTKKPWIFLLGILIGSLFGDIAWIFKLTREIISPESSYALVTFFIRIAWAFLIVQYQALSFFIQSLAQKNFRLKLFDKLLVTICSLFVIYFLFLAFFYPLTLIDEQERERAKSLGSTPPLEIQIMRYVVLYLLPCIIIPGLYRTIQKLRTARLPKILRKQLRIFIQYLICPYLLVEFLQAGHFNFIFMHISFYPVVSISTLLITYAVYYCIRKVMGLRFLNAVHHVQAKEKITVINDFKNVLEQLSGVTSAQELGHITNTFLKDAFTIIVRTPTLYLYQQVTTESDSKSQEIKTIVEHFLTIPAITDSIKQDGILIYDEIVFTHFYEETEHNQQTITFLESINADIFIPVYAQQKMVAYIIIPHNARGSECYSDIERDEMLVFAGYLGNVINLLHNRSIEPILEKEKELKDELYFKHQEINQYKESIRSFLRHTNQKNIGILFYKNRRFTFGNLTAKELLDIDLNVQEGHPLTKELKHIAQQVELYKAPQSRLTKDTHGNNIVLSAVPHLEQNNVIITISYPDIADIIAQQIDKLKDPAKWNYLLYLETTKNGQLINQLIPSSGESLLNFKIDLLRAALNKKPIVLDMPDEDLLPTVELLHHISLRETLHILDLQSPVRNLDVGIKLFGISPTFGIKSIEQPLLDRLQNGTLFIRNIHFLDQETQKNLAEFIRYGYFHELKSDKRSSSTARIICSMQHTEPLHDGNYAQPALQELYKYTISMPSLSTLTTAELNDLVDRLGEQAIKTHTFNNLLVLNEKDKRLFLLKRPVSLQEIKLKVQQLLINKSKSNNIYHETEFDPAYEVSDPELMQAARLGKHALRDRKIMHILWNKFKNQNKIATFLGVNRSSVNRRIKEYNLHAYDER